MGREAIIESIGILDRLAVTAPAWKERHAADLGMVLAELLAYAGDHLSYRQDAVATEAYLKTARRRISVRRHLRLVDYRLHEGCNARAWVHVAVANRVELGEQWGAIKDVCGHDIGYFDVEFPRPMSDSGVIAG